MTSLLNLTIGEVDAMPEPMRSQVRQQSVASSKGLGVHSPTISGRATRTTLGKTKNDLVPAPPRRNAGQDRTCRRKDSTPLSRLHGTEKGRNENCCS